jgi:hypothetical protein
MQFVIRRKIAIHIPSLRCDFTIQFSRYFFTFVGPAFETPQMQKPEASQGEKD